MLWEDEFLILIPPHWGIGHTRCIDLGCVGCISCFRTETKVFQYESCLQVTNCSGLHPVPKKGPFQTLPRRGDQNRLTGKRLKSDLPRRELNQEEYQRRQTLGFGRLVKWFTVISWKSEWIWWCQLFVFSTLMTLYTLECIYLGVLSLQMWLSSAHQHTPTKSFKGMLQWKLIFRAWTFISRDHWSGFPFFFQIMALLYLVTFWSGCF